MFFQNDKLEFNQGYGATETTSLTTATLKGNKIHDYDSCGMNLASITLKYVNPQTGEPVPIGQVSEIVIRIFCVIIIIIDGDKRNVDF